MALVACTECGNNVSTLAAACVSCGAPVQNNQDVQGNQVESLGRRLASLVIYAVLWAFAIILILGAVKFATPLIERFDRATADSMIWGPDEICVLFLNEGIRNGAATGAEDHGKCVKELTFVKEQRPEAFRAWAGCISEAGSIKEAAKRCEI